MNGGRWRGNYCFKAKVFLVLEPLIAAKAKERQAEAGGDKKSDSAKSLSPKCEKAIEAIHTDKELEKLSGISKGCRCGGHCSAEETGEKLKEQL